jgi:glyoxylase-like metal-dependent hydrolase (beta-lactamase superfamily II)
VSSDGEAVANVGVAVLDQAVLVFDTHFTPEGGESLLAAIRSITPKPVRFVVNSHWHADHTHGNQVFAGAQVISSSNARRDMLQMDLPSLNRAVQISQTQLEKLRKDLIKETDAAQRQNMREQIKSREEYLQTMARLKITPPIATVDESVIIRDGKQEARVLVLGAGHTDGDIVLFLPAQKVVFAGDLFFCNAIPNVQDANILGWMHTLDGLIKLDADKFVPGHGPIGSKKDVEAFLHYFEDLKALVGPIVERGDSLEQATRELEVPAKYSSYQFQNFFPSNVQKMFTELKALQLESLPAEDAAKTGQRQP